MKRMIFTAVACALLLGVSIPAAALNSGENGFESLPQAEEFEEIEQLSGLALELINEELSAQYGEDAAKIHQQDLHWEEAYKIYFDVDVFATGSDTTQTLLNELEDSSSIWELAIRKDSVLVTVSFMQRGNLPENAQKAFSSSEYARKAARENRWAVHSVEFPDSAETLPEIFQSSLQQDEASSGSRKVIIGGFSKLRSAIGVTMNHRTADKVVFLQQPALAGEPKASIRRSTQISKLETGKEYDFRELARYMQGVPDACDGAMNFDLLVPGVLLGALVLFAGGMILIAFSGRRSRR